MARTVTIERVENELHVTVVSSNTENLFIRVRNVQVDDYVEKSISVSGTPQTVIFSANDLPLLLTRYFDTALTVQLCTSFFGILQPVTDAEYNILGALVLKNNGTQLSFNELTFSGETTSYEIYHNGVKIADIK